MNTIIIDKSTLNFSQTQNGSDLFGNLMNIETASIVVSLPTMDVPLKVRRFKVNGNDVYDIPGEAAMLPASMSIEIV